MEFSGGHYGGEGLRTRARLVTKLIECWTSVSLDSAERHLLHDEVQHCGVVLCELSCEVPPISNRECFVSLPNSKREEE